MEIHHEQDCAGAVRFLYSARSGRILLKLFQRSHMDRLAVTFLRSPWSKPLVPWYARRHQISLTAWDQKGFATFQDFFSRTRPNLSFDPTPNHLISPCDGRLSTYPIEENSIFSIKGSHYRLCDFLDDAEAGKQFHGGDCLIFRLTPSDYHHYCYIDNGCRGEDHLLPGVLHSVQPIACETYPVYTLNRRCWTLLKTEHFGTVAQIEVGALMVGEIFTEPGNARFLRGMEMGHFELAGSTIVLLFQKGRIQLLPSIVQGIEENEEYQVKQGMWIGTGVE